MFSCLHFFVSLFSHTCSVLSYLLFFFTHSVAFGIQKKIKNIVPLFSHTLSVPSTFFPHLSVVSLLFSLTLSFVSLLFPTLSFFFLLFFSHFHLPLFFSHTSSLSF